MNITELENLAKAATPGPWAQSTCFDIVIQSETRESLFVAKMPRGHGECSANAKFVAAANPQTILTMIELLREMGEALESIGDTACGEASHQFIALQALAKYKEMTK